jgi:hypothetical protein
MKNMTDYPSIHGRENKRPYITQSDHPGIPKGTEVWAWLEQEGQLIVLETKEGVCAKIPRRNDTTPYVVWLPGLEEPESAGICESIAAQEDAAVIAELNRAVAKYKLVD